MRMRTRYECRGDCAAVAFFFFLTFCFPFFFIYLSYFWKYIVLQYRYRASKKVYILIVKNFVKKASSLYSSRDCLLLSKLYICTLAWNFNTLNMKFVRFSVNCLQYFSILTILKKITELSASFWLKYYEILEFFRFLFFYFLYHQSLRGCAPFVTVRKGWGSQVDLLWPINKRYALTD